MKQHGKLFVLEGIDGSGKTTQYERLLARAAAEGKSLTGTTFPNYESVSGKLVSTYLGGAFGTRPGDVNAYAAASIFAVDRFASFKT
ncbi:MAG: thymidylate kinase, partial [Clostridia bacterium]|nr:thymidylate kinase [Clostridia bacterium]